MFAPSRRAVSINATILRLGGGAEPAAYIEVSADAKATPQPYLIRFESVGALPARRWVNVVAQNDAK